MLFGQKRTIRITHRSLKHLKYVFVDMTWILNEINLHMTLNTSIQLNYVNFKILPI